MSNMVVRTNVLSINSHRNLGMTGTMQARASQRLSSGFRINSAADDAAGLAISEKMRAQIRGLNQASRNAQDGISLIQTAEGAMNVVNDMVIRIRELVVQAANDTNAHDGDNLAQSDRIQIQREINQLLAEIDDITLRTEFNTRTLLDGTWAAQVPNDFAEITTLAMTVDLAMLTEPAHAENFMRFVELLGRVSDVTGQNWALPANNTERDAIGTALTAIQAFADGGTAMEADDIVTALGNLPGTGFTFQALFGLGADGWDGTDDPVDALEAADLVTAQLEAQRMMRELGFGGAAPVAGPGGTPFTTTVLEGLAGFSDLHGNVTAEAATIAGLILANETAIRAGTWAPTDAQVGGAATTAQVNALAAWANTTGAYRTALLEALDAHHAGNGDAGAPAGAGTGLWFHIGANSGQGITLHIENVNVRRLDEVGRNLSGLLVSAETEAFARGGFGFADLRNDLLRDEAGIMLMHGEEINQFINAIDAALAHVAGERANLGATQNRLEFTIENLDISSENLSAANMRIRDADMALEMMRLTQANVLQQAATAMLAQANQAPQAILQLLR